MKPRALQYIVCPNCQAALQVESEQQEGDEVLEGNLLCSACRASFPIRGGIPRFLPAALSAEKRATAAAFGYEWTRYFELRQQYLEEFLEWIRPVTAGDFAGRVVLDAGCGKGRHAFLAAGFGARDVIGIDLSDAVDAAFENTRHLPNVHILQADIYHLPFRAPFELAYSIGVLHHLPDPKQGFLSLVRHLRPGGRIVAWVYGKEGNWWIETLVNPVRVRFTSRAPKPVTRAISLLLSLPLYAALKLVYGPVHRRPRLAPLKRWLFYSDYLCAISGYSFSENFWNVFDHLVAPTAFYHSRQEVEDWFSTAGLGSVQITQLHGNSWTGTGVKEDL